MRCSECRAYMNPHMVWLDGGRKFACTFCGTLNVTPHDYVENVGPDGRRRDADTRPELSCGTYEFVAGPSFQVDSQEAHGYVREYNTAIILMSLAALHALMSALRCWSIVSRQRANLPCN